MAALRRSDQVRYGQSARSSAPTGIVLYHWALKAAASTPQPVGRAAQASRMASRTAA